MSDGYLSDRIYANRFESREGLSSEYPEICFLNRFYFIPPLCYALLIYSALGFPGLIWGFFISTTALYHCTFFINSLTHMVGRVRYKSSDGSQNSFILAILCCGEGWHNNHHHYQSAANQGWYWWEVDFSYYILSCCHGSGSCGISERLLHTSKPEPSPPRVRTR